MKECRHRLLLRSYSTVGIADLCESINCVRVCEEGFVVLMPQEFGKRANGGTGGGFSLFYFLRGFEHRIAK